MVARHSRDRDGRSPKSVDAALLDTRRGCRFAHLAIGEPHQPKAFDEGRTIRLPDSIDPTPRRCATGRGTDTRSVRWTSAS
jgi:hypothetical protein